MGSGCCKHCQGFSPNLHVREIVQQFTNQLCPVKLDSSNTNGTMKKTSDKMEDLDKPVKKGVTFTDVIDEAPVPPPRAQRRKSKLKKENALDEESEAGWETPNSQGSDDSEDIDDIEMPRNRLAELIRRDTLGKVPDLNLLPFSRFPGRRASSLELLCVDEESSESLQPARSAEQLVEPEPSEQTISERKTEWLKTILQSGGEVPLTPDEEENNNKTKIPTFLVNEDNPPDKLPTVLEEKEPTLGTLSSPKPQHSSRKSSMTESLKDFESSLIDMLKSQPKVESDDEEHKCASQPT